MRFARKFAKNFSKAFARGFASNSGGSIFFRFYQYLKLGIADDVVNKGIGGSEVDALIISGTMEGQDLVIDWTRGDVGLIALAENLGIPYPQISWAQMKALNLEFINKNDFTLNNVTDVIKDWAANAYVKLLDVNGNPILDENGNVIWAVKEYYDLTTSVDGAGTIYPPPNTYKIGQRNSVTIEAEPIDPETTALENVKVNDVIVSTTSPFNFVINGVSNVVAYFVALLQVVQDIFSTNATKVGNEYVILDQSGNNNNIVIKRFQQITLTGIDYIRTPLNFGGLNKLTIQAKIRKNGGGDLINGTQSNGTGNTNITGFVYYNDEKLYAYINGVYLVSAITLPIGIDYIITTVFDGTALESQRLKLYINGILHLTKALTSTIINTAENNFRMGLYVLPIGNGIISYTSFWNEALTLEQLNDRPTSLQLPSLIEDYSFQETSGKTFYGRNGNNAWTFDNTNMFINKQENEYPVLFNEGYSLYNKNLSPTTYIRKFPTSIEGMALETNEVPLLIVLGQSNATGTFGIKGYGIGNLPVAYQGNQSNLFIYYEGNYITFNPATADFENMNPGVNTVRPEYSDPNNSAYDTGHWSVEQEWAHRVFELTGSNVYIVRSAKNGTAIAEWLSPSSAMWVETERLVLGAISKIIGIGKTPKIYTAWIQGEQDAIDLALSISYESALTNFINNYRGLSVYLTNSMFIMYRLSSSFGGGTVTTRNNVNSAYDQIERKLINTIAVNTDNLTKWDVGTHYTEESAIANGLAAFVASTGGIPNYTKIADIQPNVCSNSGNTFLGILNNPTVEQDFDTLNAIPESSTFVPTKTENTISRLIIKE